MPIFDGVWNMKGLRLLLQSADTTGKAKADQQVNRQNHSQDIKHAQAALRSHRVDRVIGRCTSDRYRSLPLRPRTPPAHKL